MPGAALLVTAGAGVPMAEGVGAFMVCAVLITRAGAAGWFARVMNRIPQALASALLAGVRARFAFDAFASLQREFVMVGLMFVVYLLGRRLWPRYAVPSVLLAGVAAQRAAGCATPVSPVITTTGIATLLLALAVTRKVISAASR